MNDGAKFGTYARSGSEDSTTSRIYYCASLWLSQLHIL